MVGAPDEYEVYRQSKAAFKQWDSDWTKNCNLNKPYYTRKLTDLAGIGRNKGIIAVAYGSSLKPALPYLKELKKHFDIICVEKAFKTLVENDIYPTYVVIADANVNYKKYGKGVDSSKSNLLINICANHEWVKNWKNNIYFYVNVDNIGTQHRYIKLTGVNESIPAASNVGNAQIVLCKVALQYAQIFFIGYDYSWKADGLYYGGEQHAEKKFNMNHIKILDMNDDLVCTSTNLDFSCRWLLTYITRFKVNGINMSGQGLFHHAVMNVPATPTFRQGDIKELLNAINKEGQKVCQN